MIKLYVKVELKVLVVKQTKLIIIRYKIIENKILKEYIEVYQ
jgi:hypothetical protein